MVRVSTLALATAAGALVYIPPGELCAFTLSAPARAAHGRSRQVRCDSQVLEGSTQAWRSCCGPSLSGLGAAAVLAVATAAGRRWRARARGVGCKSLAEGAEVLWNGKPGTVRFVGTTHFAAGEWAGIELEVEEGMHDGTVMGVTYFECPARRGVFAPTAALATRGAPSSAAVGASAAGGRTLAVGEGVAWRGKEGTVRFIGSTRFADGEWVGIELKTDDGMHNGTVMGTTYFECPPRRGVFAPAAQLEGAGAAPAAPAAERGIPGSLEGAREEEGVVPEVGAEVVWNGKEGTVRYVGATKFAAGEWVGIELEAEKGMHNGTVMGVTYFECPPRCGVFAQASQLRCGGVPESVESIAGMRVGTRVVWNGQEGTVRFLGRTKFAGGLWVGLELDSKGGLHDGKVMGVPYFSCGPGHGILAPPGAVQALGEVCLDAA